MKRRVEPTESPPPPRRRSRRLLAQAYPPLLDALWPVRTIVHSLLTDDDAARLLRTSRTTALTLLPRYTFSSHIFQPASLLSLRRLRNLSLAYDLRLTQLCLPGELESLSFDADAPHLSPIPPSVTALSLSPAHRQEPHWRALSAAAGDWQDKEAWRLPKPPSHPLPQSYGEEATERQWQLPWSVNPPNSLDCFLPYCPAPLSSCVRL